MMSEEERLTRERAIKVKLKKTGKGKTGKSNENSFVNCE